MNKPLPPIHDSSMNDDYLWNKYDSPDPLLADLEVALNTLAFNPPRELINRHRFQWSWRTVRAAAAMILLTLTVAWLAVRPHSVPWQVVQLHAGDSTSSAAPTQLLPGRWLATGSESQLQLNIPSLGHVIVQPNSRLRLLASRTGNLFTQPEHRLELDHGSIHAVIDAPPRLFFVNTRAAVAIDYGCEYTLDMNEQGVGLLRVDQGLVMLDGRSRSVLVPMNASCPMNEATGPGTPFGDHASPQLQSLLSSFDAGMRDNTTVSAILAQSDNLDTVTLWHVLEQVSPPQRMLVIMRMAEFVPIPVDVSESRILQLEPAAMLQWRDEVARRW